MSVQTIRTRSGLRVPEAAHVAVLLLPIAVYFLALGMGVALATYFAVGTAVGVTLQRARLFFVSGFRDLYLLHQGRTLRAILER